MTRKIPMLAFGLGMALASVRAFAHGNHSHGSSVDRHRTPLAKAFLPIKM